mmetsp:Transcript_30753/g.68136  ORF Transcript_30753/g.68136 Transcript_30753/m.68136 type:complete len:144 (-) Transcript_30753:399-830(-)
MEADSEKSRRQKRIEELILTEEEVDLSSTLGEGDITVVARAVARSTTLKVLNLGDSGIDSGPFRSGDAGVKLVADALKRNPDSQLETLHLSGHDMATTESIILPMHCAMPTVSFEHLISASTTSTTTELSALPVRCVMLIANW